MTSLDIIAFILTTTFVILVIFVSVAAYYLIIAMKAVKKLVDSINEKVESIENIPNIIKLRFWKILGTIFGVRR